MERKRKKLSGNTAVSKDAGKGKGGCFLILFFSLFFIAGCAFFYIFFIRPLLGILDARDWPEVPCTVISSKVESHSSSDGTTYSVEIVYKYTVAGKPYQSDRYDFTDFSSSGRNGKQKIVRRYPPGKKTICFVNPDDPNSAVLNRDFSPWMLFGALPFLFIVVGAGGMYFAVSSMRKSKKGAEDSKWQQAMSAGQDSIDFRNPEAFIASKGPQTLKAKSSPLFGFIVILMVALFWNGIVSIFLREVIEDFQRGQPNWFIAIFLIPFVLIGLGLIAGVGYTFLALFNPRPTLMIDVASTPLGGSFRLSWKFSGQTGSIRQMKIELRGQEESQYRRGTSNYTDTETFAEITILETNNFIDIGRGEARVDIPADTMHSWEADHNKVLWNIAVHGDIAWWPDVDETFPITITPHEPT